MKKIVLFSLCTAAALASCVNTGKNQDALQAQNDSLMIELSNRDAELDEIMVRSMRSRKDSVRLMKRKIVWT